MKKKKWLVMVMLVLVCSLMFGTTVCAAGTGDVAGAIEGTWKDASAQIKTVVNKVVFLECRKGKTAQKRGLSIDIYQEDGYNYSERRNAEWK